jgi:hypothetical protein
MENYTEPVSLIDHNAFLGICGESTKRRLSETVFSINGGYLSNGPWWDTTVGSTRKSHKLIRTSVFISIYSFSL